MLVCIEYSGTDIVLLQLPLSSFSELRVVSAKKQLTTSTVTAIMTIVRGGVEMLLSGCLDTRSGFYPVAMETPGC